MTPRPLLPVALALSTLAGCAGAGAQKGPGGGPPLKPADCAIEFFYKAPERPYVELGQLQEHVINVPAAGAKEALRAPACALGAEAVIVDREQVLNYFGHTMVGGTAIRWAMPAAAPERPEPIDAEPAPRAAPAPAPTPAPAAPATPPAPETKPSN
jgi:hypothetical protein